MTKVTEEQINFIHQHIKACMRKDWIEVRYELVDHIASNIEERWQDNSNLSFREAYVQTIDQLDHGREIEKIVSSQWRSAIKSYITDYFKYVTNLRHIGILICLLVFTFIATYYLIDLNQFISVLYAQIVVSVLSIIFLIVDKMRYRLNPHSQTQSLKYRCYNESKAIDLFFLIPLLFLIGEYRAISQIEVFIVGLCVFTLVSSVWFRYAIYRPTMLSEIKMFQDLEMAK